MESNNVLKITLTETMAREILWEVCKDQSRLIFTKHAKARMKERRITTVQVVRCLRMGRFTEAPCRDVHGNWKMTLEVFDSGAVVGVAVALDYRPDTGNYAVVVTVFV